MPRPRSLLLMISFVFVADHCAAEDKAAFAFSGNSNAVVDLDFSHDWVGSFERAGVWNRSNSYPGTIAYKTQTGGGLKVTDGKLIARYIPRAQSPAQSLILKLDPPLNDLWVRIRFRFKGWKWGSGPSDRSPWYTKLYRLWEIGENYQFSERYAKHYAVFGFSSSRTKGVMHPFFNVVANSEPGPNRKGSSGGPSMAFRHYPYPVKAGSVPPISSGFPEAIFGPIKSDGTIPDEDTWIDVLTHYRSATPGNDDGIVKHWVNGVAINQSKPGTAEIKYNYRSPTNRVNFPSEGAYDHVVLLDNSGALHPGTAVGAQVEVDHFSVFRFDPRRQSTK